MVGTPESLIRAEVVALQAYHVPAADGAIKLDAMENPYDWPPEMVAQWQLLKADTPVNRYPDAGAVELKSALRIAMEIGDEHALLLGNGSDEIIQIIATAMARPGATILAPEPGFTMYKMIASATGMRYVGVPLDAAFELDGEAMREAIEREQPAIVFIAYPNNPSGNLFSESAIDEILDCAPGVVVIDEAYHPFAKRSYLPRLAGHGNLLVMRTVSKMGLAGLRLGFLAGAPQWLDQFEKIRLPYNINVLTQRMAVFALQNMQVFERQARLICSERDRLFGKLADIEWLTAHPSAANFVLLQVGEKADALYSHLRDQNILVKNLCRAGPALSGCLRVTVGTASENDAFIRAVASFPDHY